MRFIHKHSTTGAAVAEIIKMTQQCYLKEFRFYLATMSTANDGGATAAADLVVSINHECTAGATFSQMEILRQTMTGVRDVLYQPEKPIYLDTNDKVLITFAAESSAKQWGLDLLVE